MLASNVSPKTNFSQAICSYANSTSESLASIIEDITFGIEGGIGSFVQGIIQNITGSIDSSPTSGASEVGLFLEGLLKNETSRAGNRTSPETSIDTFIQDLISSIFSGAESRILNAVTGTGSGLKVLLTAIINNFTTKVDNGLSKAEGSVAAGITNALGRQDFYSVHLRDVCSGTLSSSSEPHAKFNITACFPYSVAASGKSSKFCMVSKIYDNNDGP